MTSFNDMPFYLCLLLANFVCFLPMYLINIKEQPNPFAFTFESRLRKQKAFAMLNRKIGFTDPFRINFDFCAVFLLILTLELNVNIASWVMALTFAVGETYIIYMSIMLFIFKRPALFKSDMSLARSGLTLAKRNRWLILLLVLLILTGFVSIGYTLAQWLIENRPDKLYLMALFVLGLGALALYNVHKYAYKDLHWKTVFSPLVHAIFNIIDGYKFNAIGTMSRKYFAKLNKFGELELKHKPNMLHICIESYGSVVFTDPAFSQAREALFEEYEQKLTTLGFKMSSVLSTSPIFSGGSWLSYSSFMYGIKLDDLQMFDALFVSSEHFEEYHSIFHLLRKNGYQSVLLSSMGGVDRRDVHWSSIKRCFQADTIIDWEAMNYTGNRIRFFNQPDRYSPPEQYSLNFAYEYCKTHVKHPYSLFYCTLNSHIPWESPIRIVENWKSLNNKEHSIELTTEKERNSLEKYCISIRYQLETVFDLLLKNPSDELILTLFGDHQPPILATEKAGLETPVHVISKNIEFNDALIEKGFVSGLNLLGTRQKIRHEGYQSILVHALNKGFGVIPEKNFPNMPNGAPLMPDE